MDVAARRGMSIEEFLAWDDARDGKWEFDGFDPVALVGGTRGHTAIATNLAVSLGTRLRGGPCTAYVEGLRVRVAGSIRYPDAFVSCTPIANEATEAEAPVVVFEVLSPSTASTDGIIKAAEYRDTPSIQRYVVLPQDHIAANVYERRGADWVSVLVTDPAAILGMPEIGISIPLDELYIGVIGF